MKAMNFGQAIEALKGGLRVARAGWNGKGMWLRLVQPYTDRFFKTTELPLPADSIDPGTLLPWIGMKTADNGFVPWLASQTDMLAEDWSIMDAAVTAALAGCAETANTRCEAAIPWHESAKASTAMAATSATNAAASASQAAASSRDAAGSLQNALVRTSLAIDSNGFLSGVGAITSAKIAGGTPETWRPRLGQDVIVRGYIANGTDEHPGIITRVHGVSEGALVNVTAFPDLQSPKLFPSIPVYTSRKAAREALAGPSRANGYAYLQA